MKIAIFDFDGVIADSTEAINKAFNEISSLKNVPPLSKEEISSLSTKKLLKRLKIRWFQIPYYLNLSRKIIKMHQDLISIEPQILEMFKNIHSKNIKFMILSSNSEKMISEFVRINLPSVKFNEIIGDVSLFGKSIKIKKVLKKYSNNNYEFFYIGDEVRDIIAARKANIKSVAVLWGKENESILSLENPTFIAKNGIELANFLEK